MTEWPVINLRSVVTHVRDDGEPIYERVVSADYANWLLDRLIEALAYADHLSNCQWYDHGDACTCGLDSFRAACERQGVKA